MPKARPARGRVSRTSSAYPQQRTIGGKVDAAGGEIIEGPRGDIDQVAGNEGRSFRRSLLGILDAAFPFEHGPAVEIMLRQLREDRPEIDLAVAEGTEPPGTLRPGLKAGIDALPAARIELGVLHMEHADALVIDVDERQVVELLQQEMAGVVEDVAAR